MNEQATAALDRISVVLRALAPGDGTRHERLAAVWGDLGSVESGDPETDRQVADLADRLDAPTIVTLSDADVDAVANELIDVHRRLLELRYA